jgi:hypothetical protein
MNKKAGATTPALLLYRQSIVGPVFALHLRAAIQPPPAAAFIGPARQSWDEWEVERVPAGTTGTCGAAEAAPVQRETTDFAFSQIWFEDAILSP